MKYIIALGNIMRSDDGIAAHIINGIIDNKLEHGFQALDIASNVWGILPLLTIETEKILIIDCAHMQEKPGTAKFFTLNCIIEQKINSAESHETSMIQLLEVAKKADYPIPNISIMGIEPESEEYALSLSAILEDKLDEYVQQAIQFISS